MVAAIFQYSAFCIYDEMTVRSLHRGGGLPYFTFGNISLFSNAFVGSADALKHHRFTRGFAAWSIDRHSKQVHDR